MGGVHDGKVGRGEKEAGMGMAGRGYGASSPKECDALIPLRAGQCDGAPLELCDSGVER